MPGKSRHRRGKYTVQGKRRKGRRNPQATVSQQEASAQVKKAVDTPPQVITPSSSISDITPATVKYPHLPYELRRIGILAGVMLATLILLVLVLD